MIAEPAPKTYTPKKYLELEINAEERHEYVSGKIRLITGGTPNHNDIAGNLYIPLKLKLKKDYRIFYADQRLWIPQCECYTYPDIMVVKKPIQLQAGRTDTVMNPCFIAEVLSKSTQDYDRGEKFVSYQTMENFQEYLLIDQYRVHVEHYVKTSANQWLFSEYNDATVVLSLSCLGFEIKIADLYTDIDFHKPEQN